MGRLLLNDRDSLWSCWLRKNYSTHIWKRDVRRPTHTHTHTCCCCCDCESSREWISCFLPHRAQGKQTACCQSFSKVPGNILADQFHGDWRQSWVSHPLGYTHTHTIKASWDMWLFHHMMFIVWKIISLLFLFSESTDDDKVVAWHWEEVKGPLREEKVSADTPVLTLTGLVPGNYTFKYCPVPLRLMLQPQTVYKKWTLK